MLEAIESFSAICAWFPPSPYLVALRAQGFSYHLIATILNILKYRTKRADARWHDATVMKILQLIKNVARQ